IERAIVAVLVRGECPGRAVLDVVDLNGHARQDALRFIENRSVDRPGRRLGEEGGWQREEGKQRNAEDRSDTRSHMTLPLVLPLTVSVHGFPGLVKPNFGDIQRASLVID